MTTVRFLWAWAFDRTVTWTDPETGKQVTEHWDRREFWGVFYPSWFDTFLTTNPGCGCRKRLGRWNTLTCSDHLPAWAKGRAS